MSGQDSFRCTSVFFGFIILALGSLSSCYAQRGVTFEANHELKDTTIRDDAALTLYDVKQPLTCARRCYENFACAFFFHNPADGVCVLHRSPFMSFNLTHAPGYQFFTMAELPEVTWDMDSGLCPSETETPRGCWKQISGSLAQVSVGPAGVWGVKQSGHIHHINGTYGDPSSWGQKSLEVWGNIGQVNVGSDTMFGVNDNNHDLCRREDITSSLHIGSGWRIVVRNRTWVSVSPAGSVWSVDLSGQVLHARASAKQLKLKTEWDVVVAATNMRQVDAGRAGVWALDDAGHLHHRRGTYEGYDDNNNEVSSTGTEWVMLAGSTFDFVSAGTNFVVGVTSEGRVWIRVGVSPDTPSGLGWALYPGVMKQVDIYEAGTVAALWAVDFSNEIYFSLIEK